MKNTPNNSAHTRNVGGKWEVNIARTLSLESSRARRSNNIPGSVCHGRPWHANLAQRVACTPYGFFSIRLSAVVTIGITVRIVVAGSFFPSFLAEQSITQNTRLHYISSIAQ